MKRNWYQKRFFLAILSIPIIAMLIIVTQPVYTAQAEGGAIVRCEPAAITVGIGEMQSIDLYVQDVIGLNAVDLEIDFDPTYATVVDVDPFTPGVQIVPLTDLISPDLLLFRIADNGTGEIHYAVTQAAQPPVDGSGAVARVFFEGVTDGVFTMTYFRSDLSDINGVLIPNTTETCQVTVGTPTAIQIRTAETSSLDSGLFNIAGVLVLLLGTVTALTLVYSRRQQRPTNIS